MSMFPGAGAQIYHNEAGEPLGWDYPSEPDLGDQDEIDERYSPDTIECGCGAVINDNENDILGHNDTECRFFGGIPF